MINPRNIDKFPHNNIGLPDPWTAIVVRNISKTLQKRVIALSCDSWARALYCELQIRIRTQWQWSWISDTGPCLGPHTTFVLQRSSKSALFLWFLLHPAQIRDYWAGPCPALVWLAVIGSSLGASQCVFALSQACKEWNTIFSGKVLPAGLQDTVILLLSQILKILAQWPIGCH